MTQAPSPAIDDSGLLDATLAHLRALVAFDTRNPPRAIHAGGIFDYIRSHLIGFDCSVTDHGAGAVALYAVRGRPRLLFNVHLDTVPDSAQWTANPFELRVDEDRATGLGACDIKGAAAALLAVAGACEGDMALLFTSDEEGADPRCVDGFLASASWSGRPAVGSGSPAPRFDTVLVAEPTGCKAVLAHRGIQSVRVRFAGRAGHASGELKPTDNALHQAARWSVAALDFAASQADQAFGELRGLRFNLGRIEGGIKSNMIAPDAELQFGMRPLPSMSPDGLLDTLRTLVEPLPAEYRETFRGPPLPACDPDRAEKARASAEAAVRRLGLAIGGAVDFWTEASLFSRAGCTALVFGPGDIAQAHAADEWVSLRQLQAYSETLLCIVAERGHRSPLPVSVDPGIGRP
jgi:acetylornithine deacetylase